MHLETYLFTEIPESHYYEFYSEGPKGKIRKVVEYFKFQDFEEDIYNLAFGDWDENQHTINDLSVSNNADRDKVLSTVAATVIDFMEKHPDAIIIATGSTPARSRLYQMGIARLWSDINLIFEVYGYINDNWQPFKRGNNYKSFLLRLK